MPSSGAAPRYGRGQACGLLCRRRCGYVTPDSGTSDADSREKSGELDAGEPGAADQDKESQSTAQHKVLLGRKDYKRLKHGKDVPFDAELQ